MSSVSGVQPPLEFQIAVAKQQLDSTREQGRQALALIDASTAPAPNANGASPNTPAGVGENVNIVA